MKYGHFDDVHQEYVITTPKTPLPWINYLGCNEFFSLISNTCGGYTFYKDAKLLRLTRYRYNNVPADINGKYLYIKDGDTVWNPGWQPTKTELDSYECRHGIGYSRFTSSKNGVKASVLSFVPLNDNCEISQLTLTNGSSEDKKLSVFSYVEWCLWNADDDMKNFQRNLSTGEVEVQDSTIYHKTEYRERRNHYAIYSVNTKIDGFDTSRDAFLGAYRGADSPEAVENGKCTNSMASGWSPIASHQINVDLAAGETKTFIFVLGYIENPEDEKWESYGVINKTRAKEMLAKYQTDAQVDEAFAALQAYWKQLLARYTVDSADEKVNRMVNTWNQYQCMVTFNMSRSASYYESGIGRGMGFRDSNQDLLGFVHQIPERARERIVDIASTQFEDGSAYHQYQPLTKQGNNEIGSGFNDDPLWLILGTVAYIKETGDYGILDEQVPFDCDKNNTATLLEHLNRSFGHVINNLGPHGLPLIGRADWNDCLNLNCFSEIPDESFQITGDDDGKIAESVLIAGMFVYIGREFARLYKALGNDEMYENVSYEIKKMTEAVLEHGYDGEWFIRAYDANGNKVGSNECDEGKIFIESNGFCVMAGIGKEDGKAQKALDSVKKYLECEYGIVLNYPPYSRYRLELGEISSYPPGYKENAGVFCHNNPWVMIGEAAMGNGERAFELYKKIAPAYLEDISEIHRTEPYVYSQMIAGRDAVRAGEAKNSWLTGTAAWNYYTVSQYLLGIRPDFDGLIIEPCISKGISEFKITRKFRGTIYNISVKNIGEGTVKITADNGVVNGTTVSSDAEICNVEVVM